MKRVGFHLCWGAIGLLLIGAAACDSGNNTADTIFVTLTSPATESYVGGQVTVTANANGEGGQVVLHHAASDLSLTRYTADEMWFIHMAAGADLDMAANVNEGTQVGFVAV